MKLKSFSTEAKDRGENLLKSFDNFNSIDGNLYPIYWGKRPYEHLDNPKGTGSIRLSTYDSLKNKTIHTVVVMVMIMTNWSVIYKKVYVSA